MAKKKEKAWWNSLNKFTGQMGSDYSHTYTTKKKTEFYVMKSNQNEISQIVLFKPFLEDLTYSFSIKTKEFGPNPVDANPDHLITGQDASIKVSLNLPAVSLNEAKINAKKVDFFLRMLSTDDIATLLNNSEILKETLEGLKEENKKHTEEQKKKEQQKKQEKIEKEQKKQDAESEDDIEEEETIDLDSEPSIAESEAAEAINNNKPSANQNTTPTPKDIPAIEDNSKEVDDSIIYTPGPAAVNAQAEQVLDYDADSIYQSYNGSPNAFFVFFNSMIQSGKFTKSVKVVDYGKPAEDSYKNMKTYGFYCSIMDIDVSVDIDMGFFEQSGGFLWPKAYKISFTMDMLNGMGFGEIQKNIIGFGKNEDDPESYTIKQTEKVAGKTIAIEPNYHKDDVKHWPFGIVRANNSYKSALSKIGDDYSSKYIQNKTGMIEFSKFEHKVSFKPFLNKFDIKRKIDSKNVVESKSLQSKSILVFNTKQPSFNIGFDVIATSISEAIVNQEKMQRFLRMIWAPQTGTNQTKKAQVHVKFGNLINKNTILGIGQSSLADTGLRVVCKSVSFKPDLDMGFFEHKGMLYMKSYKLSLILETVDSTLLVRI